MSDPKLSIRPVLSEGHSRLRLYNAAMGLLHALQGLAILILANGFTLPVKGTFLEGPPGSAALDPVNLLNVPVAWGVAAFLFLSAAFHLLISTPMYYERYSSGLIHGRNYFRWVEYSLSSSLMIVLIAMLSGISEVAALIALFGVNASMIFLAPFKRNTNVPVDPSCLSGWAASRAPFPGWRSASICSLRAASPSLPDSYTAYSSPCLPSSTSSQSTCGFSAERVGGGAGRGLEAVERLPVAALAVVERGGDPRDGRGARASPA